MINRANSNASMRTPKATNKQTLAKLMKTQMAIKEKNNMQNAYNTILKQSPALTPQIANMLNNPKISTFTELLNSATNKFEKVMGVAKFANSMLPPNKQVNMQNAVKLGENAFKGLKSPTNGEQLNVMNGSYGLSKAPNPKSVNLNSGVAPTCYANDFMNPIEGTCSPMHVTSQILGLPTALSNPLGDYLIKTIAFDVQTRAQANVNFSLDLVTSFSATQIISSMNDVVRALQVYYYYSSILSYEADSRNKNSAMISLRSNISSQMISDLVSLGRRLEDTPCPPRIVQWVRYMSMNYLSGDSQGSPLLKITPVGDFENNYTLISDTLTTISNSTNSSTFVLMRRAIPQWRIGTLFDVPVNPVFDKNFLTIFANLRCAVYNSANTIIYGLPAALVTDPISYNSFNNRLDGAAYAMTSVGIIAGGIIPGLCTHITPTTFNPSRKSFYKLGSTVGWYESSKYQFLAISRPETYRLVNPADTVVSKSHLSGAEMCQGVDANSIVQSAKNFVDFLFDINKISTTGKLNSFNKRSGSI